MPFFEGGGAVNEGLEGGVSSSIGVADIQPRKWNSEGYFEEADGGAEAAAAPGGMNPLVAAMMRTSAGGGGGNDGGMNPLVAAMLAGGGAALGFKMAELGTKSARGRPAQPSAH